MALEDLTQYQYGALAGRLLQSKEGQMYVPGALEELASDMGYESDSPFVIGTNASNEGIQAAVNNAYGRYEKAEGELSIKDFYNTYKEYFEDGLSDEEKEIVKGKYVSNDANVGEIKGKIAELQHDAGSPNAEKRKEAEKELEKYQDIIQMFAIVQDNLYKNLLPKAIERTNQTRLKMLAKK
ncbi:hypothetical protein KAT24_02910 [Candidatus Pacearchaeota archaeon]|nr:hypothetical protein [Candidatus Pacearchaeota archaeon]